MVSDEELFTHEVEPWTVGDLRKAIEGVPDSLPLRAFIGGEPGGDVTYERVVHYAAPWNEVNGGAENPDCFTIECDFPPGEYVRRSSGA